MSVAFDFADRVVLVTGAAGALGSEVAAAFNRAGATTVGVDVVDLADANALLAADDVQTFLTGDLTDPADTERVVDEVIDAHGRLDVLANIAGTWRGGNPIEETKIGEFELVFNVNLKTMFLTSKYALPHLQETGGSIISVSARSSLSGGTGDGPYRAAKAGIRLLTESIAEENTGTVRANAIMPSIIDTPDNREMLPDADHDTWVDPAEIADVIRWLASDGSEVTSGAAVPVYGEA